jgi:hypothetical protein
MARARESAENARCAAIMSLVANLALRENKTTPADFLP